MIKIVTRNLEILAALFLSLSLSMKQSSTIQRKHHGKVLGIYQ